MNGVFQTMLEENKAMCGVVVECGFPIKKVCRIAKIIFQTQNLKLVLWKICITILLYNRYA